MRFAYHPSMCDPSHYIPLAKSVEAAGWEALTFPDSICFPQQASSKYPYNKDGSNAFLENVPFMEPFVMIPALAAVTESLCFSTSVVKLPIRQPVLVAKQAATLATMSNNRFVFGVGISPWYEDFEICGERWEGRGKRFDQMIEIVRGLMSGDFYGYDSEYYQIPACKICPVPSKPVPILVGGHADVALRRAARIADGWISAGNKLEDLTRLVQRIQELRREYGTDERPFQFHAITPEAYSADGIKRLEELGITECIISFRDIYSSQPDPSLQQKLATIDWYTNEVILKSRA